MIDVIADKLYESILDALGGNEWIGKRGEKLTEKELKWLKLFNKNGLTLKNIYLPKENGETSEIDLVYITVKGIFVIESKNYSGWIFGDESSYNWTAMLPNKDKNRFYNPILQNKTHIKWLLNYIGEDIPIFSVIVFSERCELKAVPNGTNKLRVIKRDKLVGNIRDMWDKAEESITSDKVNEVYEQLKVLTNADEAVRRTHIENINKKYKEHDSDELISVKSCPRCGSKLVLRTVKSGTNAGKQFYGCSAFPKCRYTENIS